MVCCFRFCSPPPFSDKGTEDMLEASTTKERPFPITQSPFRSVTAVIQDTSTHLGSVHGCHHAAKSVKRNREGSVWKRWLEIHNTQCVLVAVGLISRPNASRVEGSQSLLAVFFPEQTGRHLLTEINVSMLVSTQTPCRPTMSPYLMCGIPTPPCRILYSLLSYNNCGCLAFCDSNLTATSWKIETRQQIHFNIYHSFYY